jgi:multidrug efflux pump subunit AcrA (membrane-fusion protein)
VEFTVTGGDRRITGQIDRINPVVDSTTRQVRIYVSIPNLDRALVAGLFAEGRVATDTKRAVAVPLTAVDSRGTTPEVHLIKRGRVAETDVQLGVRDEAAELVEVLAGAAEGDTVLLGSAQGLTAGSRVQVLQQEATR